MTKKIDALLKLRGFVRRGRRWNRRSGPFVDAVELQLAKSHQMLTLNVGVLDTNAYEVFWGAKAPLFVPEPSCIVRSRPQRERGLDKWWDLDGLVVDEMLGQLEGELLPFLARMHDHGAMKEFLAGSRVGIGLFPPPNIYFAILCGASGERERCSALLKELKTQYSRRGTAWAVRIDEILGRLQL